MATNFKFIGLSLGLIASCSNSNTNFTGNGTAEKRTTTTAKSSGDTAAKTDPTSANPAASPSASTSSASPAPSTTLDAPKTATVAPAPLPALGSLVANLTLTAGAKSLKLSGHFAPTNKAPLNATDVTCDYVWVPSALTSTLAGGFPSDLAQQISASTFSATVKHAASTSTDLELDIKMSTHDITSNGKPVQPQSMTFTQSAAQPQWAKNEGVLTAFGSIDSSTTTSANCQISPTTNQPQGGVYAVILTQPAPCDFQMPTITVEQGSVGNKAVVPIGTYWLASPTMAVAHSFPLTTPSTGPIGANNTPVDLDNGFILIQPDGRSYLLADGGHARPTVASYHSAQMVANDVSQTLGFGNTQLLQPDPAKTTFLKGSVIIMYDDTPDMGGNLDTYAVISSATSTGVSLQWDAEVK